jgi:D-alanyl-D-alanine carboxypeptidase/D-alanyl-D-alanine-endopeptidase (penicillin-binding protein 4)
MRCLAALLALVLSLPALAGSEFEAWVKRQQAKGTRLSAGLWELSTGKAIEGHQPDLALVPASTTKVVSTYAMLRTWKPDFQVETEVWGDVQGNAVKGDLTLKGGGDPFLTDERIWMLAQELKALGVFRVTGSLRLDQSAFDGQRYGNGWENTSSNTTPAIAPLSVNFNRDPRGKLVGDPDRLALDTIRKVFTEAGIAIEGGAGISTAPRKLVVFPSPPLRQLLADINKFSNNFMVEMLLKRFGDGSWSRGIQRVQEFYRATYNLGADKIAITDGSGLSKDNQLSAKTLAVILRGAWHDFEVGPEFASTLKVIGGEPFKLRIKDPNLARRVRVKTGHLSGVSSACGYVQTPDGKVRVFAILLNGNCHENDVWEQVSRWAN